MGCIEIPRTVIKYSKSMRSVKIPKTLSKYSKYQLQYHKYKPLSVLNLIVNIEVDSHR